MLLAEACVMQVLNKRFSPTEGFDTPIEIRISRLVMTHHSANERENAGKIEIIHRFLKRGTSPAVRRPGR